MGCKFCYQVASTSSDFFLRVRLGSCSKEIKISLDLLSGGGVGGLVGWEVAGWGGRDCSVL